MTFRNVGSSADSLKAALAKQIDCGYGQVGDQPLAAKDGVRMIATVSEELPLWINQGAVASAKAIASKRQSLVRCSPPTRSCSATWRRRNPSSPM